MTSILVFNHHSLPFATASDAGKAIPDFLNICIKSQNMGFTTIIADGAVDPSWFGLELAEGYSWRDWHGKNYHGENRDIIRTFLSIATRQPFFSMEDSEMDVDLFDVRLNDDPTFLALRVAGWHEAPLVSLPTHKPWLDSPLQVIVETLDEAGEIVSQLLNLLNFYSWENFNNEAPVLHQQRISLVTSGKELIEKQKQLFPNITFCGSTHQQLTHWSASKMILNQVKESLSSLNSFCEQWAEGTYKSYHHEFLREVGLNHKVSGESHTVMRNSHLRGHREFWLPEGRKEFFENHVKLSKNYRLHFFPDDQAKRIYIGHIGPHLKLS